MREAEPSKRLRAENKPQEEMRWEKEHNITKCKLKCKGSTIKIIFSNSTT